MILIMEDILGVTYCFGEVCKTGYYWLGTTVPQFVLPGIIIACALIIWKKRKNKPKKPKPDISRF